MNNTYELLQAFVDDESENKTIFTRILKYAGDEEKLASIMEGWFDALGIIIEDANTSYDVISDDKLLCKGTELLINKFPKLKSEDAEKFTDQILRYSNKFYETSTDKKLEEFENFLSDKYEFRNKFASRKQAIEALFNITNDTGHRIGSSDIYEAPAEISIKIIHETCIFDDAGEIKTLCTLPASWDDERGLFTINLSNDEYTPVVVDHKERKVYFSLQGNLKMMNDKMAYDGWRAEHIRQEEASKFHDEITSTKWYREYFRDTKYNKDIDVMGLHVRMSEKLGLSIERAIFDKFLKENNDSYMVPIVPEEDLTQDERQAVIDGEYTGEQEIRYMSPMNAIVIEYIDKYKMDRGQYDAMAGLLGLESREYLILYRDTYREMCIENKNKFGSNAKPKPEKFRLY